MRERAKRSSCREAGASYQRKVAIANERHRERGNAHQVPRHASPASIALGTLAVVLILPHDRNADEPLREVPRPVPSPSSRCSRGEEPRALVRAGRRRRRRARLPPAQPSRPRPRPRPGARVPPAKHDPPLAQHVPEGRLRARARALEVLEDEDLREGPRAGVVNSGVGIGGVGQEGRGRRAREGRVGRGGEAGAGRAGRGALRCRGCRG